MISVQADCRALELLHQHLTPQERDMAARSYVQFKGRSGRWYCVHWVHRFSQPDVYTLRRSLRGQRRHNRILCCKVRGYSEFPIADQVLALKLCLQSKDERRVWRKATKSRVRSYIHA